MKELFVFFGGVPLAIFGSAALVACFDSAPPVPRISFHRYCFTEQSERVAQFIVDCANAANPKSDEEGEDLVEQCERTAKNIFCPEVAHVSGAAEVFAKPCPLVKEPVEHVQACKAYVK